MTISRKEAVVAASTAADAVYRALGGKGAGWWQRLGGTLADHAEFVELNRGAPAEALYRHALGQLIAEAPWRSDLALAAAVETFEMVLLSLLALVPKVEPAPATVVRAGGFGKRTFDKRSKSGFGHRVRWGNAMPEATAAAETVLVTDDGASGAPRHSIIASGTLPGTPEADAAYATPAAKEQPVPFRYKGLKSKK